MMENAKITILVSKELKGQDHGHLYGSFIRSQDELNSTVIVVTSVNPERILPIGCINNNGQKQTCKITRNIWIELCTRPEIQISSVRVAGENVCLEGVNVVIYCSKEICESELVSRKFNYEEHDHTNNIVPYFINRVQTDCKKPELCWRERYLLELLLFITRTICFLLLLPKFVMEKVDTFADTELSYSSSFLKQSLLRIKQIEKLTEELETGKSALLVGRLLVMILTDILIGIAVIFFISKIASYDDIYSVFSTSTRVLASNVHSLLEWLKGAPAGLKLNQPLTQALSSFFSYHVYLWRLYLDLVTPFLRSCAPGFLWLGVFGASIQVAILADLLNMATMHLYCFYVYAARIHMLQVSLLGSQWRAFRGKKWNPLKQRVDSYESEGGHMSRTRVLTVVIFTLVVFLMPTTTTYYMVFVILRIGLNMVKGLLALITWSLNVNPLYLLYELFMDSNRIKGDIYFETQLTNCSKSKHFIAAPLTLCLHTWPTRLNEILIYSHADVFPALPTPEWKALFCSLIFAIDLL